MEDTVPAEVQKEVQKEDTRRKISEGMRRSHELRRRLREAKKKQKAEAGHPRAPSDKGLLARLIKERDALNIVIESLKQRGVT